VAKLDLKALRDFAAGVAALPSDHQWNVELNPGDVLKMADVVLAAEELFAAEILMEAPIAFETRLRNRHEAEQKLFAAVKRLIPPT